MNLTELKQVVKTCTQQLNEMGVSVPTMLQYRVSGRLTRALGNCAERRRFDGTIVSLVITISKDLPLSIAPNTVMHELIHAVVGARAGHGPIFHSMAGRVNRAYGYNISTYADPTSSAIIREVRASKTGHSVTCTSCGNSRAITASQKIFKHPEFYRCRCGGTLEVK